ncbi:MAG: hypothetical protein EBE86_031010 [Hormoscilla sp. GUM202]|nr:hypothetical protein [Hormoscilla sp. GUM202]
MTTPHYLWQQIKQFDSVSYIYYGNEQREALGAARLAARQMVDTRLVLGRSGKSTNYTYQEYVTDKEGNPEELVAGCDDFIRKPFREAEIFETMSKHMGLRYVMAEPTTISVLDLPSRVTPSDLLLLPPELLAELENAILCSEPDRLDEAIALMGTHHETLAQEMHW